MRRKTLAQRVFDKFTAGDECWEWTGNRWANGYGQLWAREGDPVLAHRAVYQVLVGPIPDGLQLDHLCRNRICVRPDHLEPVTQQENIRRGEAGKYLADRTHCGRGHPFDEANTLVRTDRPGRRCRICQNEKNREYRARRHP